MTRPSQAGGARTIFMSAGEASGDMLAATLAGAMRAHDPALAFEGIGGERMSAAGFSITQSNAGWASMGPLNAIAKIPKLYSVMVRHVAHLRRSPAALVVLIDFGAFNLRFAKTLRLTGYTRPIVYLLPPGAWLDRESSARAVARYARPLTAFEHQRDFYRSLGLDIAFFGHPIASLIEARAPRPAPPTDGGTLALLPGSRAGEITYHLPLLAQATARLREQRPGLDVVIGYADALARATIESMPKAIPPGARLVPGAAIALDAADAAIVASGTAVLEAALRGTPSVALYVVSDAQAKIGRRMYHGAYVTLPNLILNEGVIPELLQEAATPAALAAAAGALLDDPASQLDRLAPLRERLGPPDALDLCAAFALGAAG
jgi:lipid-A-disaccharide synthase